MTPQLLDDVKTEFVLNRFQLRFVWKSRFAEWLWLLFTILL